MTLSGVASMVGVMQQTPEIDLDKRGAYSALARKLGLTRSIVSAWFSGKVRIPAERAVEVERLTGRKRSELRPDLWSD